MPAKTLPKAFPFADVISQFMREYSECTTYWYVPKATSLSDSRVKAIRTILSVIRDTCLDQVWSRETQDRLLTTLKKKRIVDPYKRGATLVDRTALMRIWKVLLETLGLLYVRNNQSLVITDAGMALLSQANGRPIIESQIAKVQYPNPNLDEGYRTDFSGIVPHLFLLQVLCEFDNRITFEEFELFVNLGSDQNDFSRICKYISTWRDLSASERETVVRIVRTISMAEGSQASLLAIDSTHKRFTRIANDGAYQRAFFCYPHYLRVSRTDRGYLECAKPQIVADIVHDTLKDFKVTKFESIESWLAYFGNPSQKPTWFTFLSESIEKADNTAQAKALVKKHHAQLQTQLSEEEKKEIHRKQVEKAIETFYVTDVQLIENGLVFLDRQYETPIGRIDILCKGDRGEYVVIEVKANEAEDSVFGQILRYMGWVHRNVADGQFNVRGIILASGFPETARYSRIGLLRKDHKAFIGFKKHGLDIENL